MATFRCTSCGLEIEAGIPPIVCRSCQARGKFVDAAKVPRPDSDRPTTSPNQTTSKETDAEQPPLERAKVIRADEKTTAEKTIAEKTIAEKTIAEKSTAEKTTTERAAVAESVPIAKAPAPKGSEQVVWRYRPSSVASVKPHPLRGCPAVDGQGRTFVAVGSNLVMLTGDNPVPQWVYNTGGPIPRSPAIGPDGTVRVHSADGYLHLVDPSGRRVGEPAAVGPPLGWATPLIDAHGRTWIARSDGGLVAVEPDGRMPRRPFYRSRRRFDCTGLILGDTLYIGCEDHFVHAVPLTAQRGDNAWNSAAGAGRTGCAISSPLALTPAAELLVVSQDDRLHCFSQDGAANWKVPLPGQVLGGLVVDGEGTMYLGISQTPRHQSPTGMLLAIDGATRRVRWQYPAQAPVESTPVIGNDGVIYFGDNAGSIHAVNRGGTLLWQADMDGPVRSAGTILAPNLVAFGLDDGSLVALRCSSSAVAPDGWPKFQRTLQQSGHESELEASARSE